MGLLLFTSYLVFGVMFNVYLWRTKGHVRNWHLLFVWTVFAPFTFTILLICGLICVLDWLRQEA